MLIMVIMIFIPGIGFPQKTKPLNVVLVLVDDMGYGDIAAHGNPVIKTPNFDKLYEESARFTNFSVSPSCSPTRASLLTGRQTGLVGVFHQSPPMNRMSTDAITIAQLFQNKGYRTGIFGKWSLGFNEQYGPWFRGFDETLETLDDTQNSHFDPVLLQNREKKQFRGYREDILFREASKFIDINKNGPFFCYLPTYSPHGPNKAPEKYTKPYEGYINTERPDGIYSAGFFGQIANIDENLGRLRVFIDSLGLTDNTLLIVINDNGGTRGVDTYNSGMRGVKGTVWRGGTRAYSFWKWGNHFPPGDRNQMCGHIDIFPTLAELCELNVSADVKKVLNGNSLRPLLENPAAKLDENRMQIHNAGRPYKDKNWKDHKYSGCSVLWGNYTLVRVEPCQNISCDPCLQLRKRGIDKTGFLYSNDPENYKLTTAGKWELFDIESDPHQDNDIAALHPEIVSKMSDYYENWWVKVEPVLKINWEEYQQAELKITN